MEDDKFIDVKALIKSKNPALIKWIPRFIVRYLEKILHQKEINEFIKKNKDIENENFCVEVIKYLEIEVEIIGLEKIPKSGGITLVMNHPLGGMDALALVSGLKNHRTDLKFIVNDLLLHLKSMKGMFVGVNKHGKSSEGTHEKIDSLFASESAVCIFPAGLVSRKINGEIKDLDWKKTFVSLSKKHENCIIPIYIDGKLSNFFYNLSNFRKFIGIKANIEMLYLSNELFKLKGKTIKFIVGEPINYQEIDDKNSHRNWARKIKELVYKLKQ
jgi:putative hemolysin